MLVILNTEMDPELLNEGAAREIINRVQRLRKKYTATAEQMEGCVEFRTYESIIARCEASQSELAYFLCSELPAGVSRILVLQWEAGKLKARNARPPQTTPEAATTPSSSSLGSRPLHGFMSAQVNHNKGVIFLAHSFTRGPISTGQVRGVIAAGTAAHRDNYPNSPRFAHICAPLFRVDPSAPDRLHHSHPLNWGGLGFGPVEKYVVGKPVEESLFDEPGIFPDSGCASQVEMRQSGQKWSRCKSASTTDRVANGHREELFLGQNEPLLATTSSSFPLEGVPSSTSSAARVETVGSQCARLPISEITNLVGAEGTREDWQGVYGKVPHPCLPH
ncbi:hypothetical protein BDK51DRAFT_26329 [Blyttiomyces helicus]|uniref:Uncharacterized protein n=1 Tax=Blyttiomyces helicus TaxID=388810 RepID=A0A4P9W576_9FUNG|nr:hypothetical protein BDK51DRAFT_26329 [Blyttiomyces helicus]|eukprot:RKO86048.1 hypothetical protein BDK51DRAFT_26329 [Blyttiomyces helicus]